MTPPPSYTYAEFLRRFGGAARTKNLRRTEDAKPDARGRRVYPMPTTCELPPEFIRLDPWEMEYLFTVARRARRGIVEIGRFNGGSLFTIACAAAADVPITSIDIAPKDDALLAELLRMHRPDANIALIVGDSHAPDYSQVGQADLLFIDGDHSYRGCLGDIERWYGKVAAGGHILFHDAYMGSNGVQDAILDFMQDKPELRIVVSPYIGAMYWTLPAGSICHLQKVG